MLFFPFFFQSVPPTIWYRLVAGLNCQLRLVRCGHLKLTFGHVISWLETHANPTLITYGVCVDLGWFQPTSSGYCQFGLIVCATGNESVRYWTGRQDRCLPPMEHSWYQLFDSVSLAISSNIKFALT